MNIWLIYCKSFDIIWHEEILSYDTFPMLRVSKLCSSFTNNNSGGEFWYFRYDKYTMTYLKLVGMEAHFILSHTLCRKDSLQKLTLKSLNE